MVWNISNGSPLGASVESVEITDGAVTEAKIADDAITNAKLGTGTWKRIYYNELTSGSPTSWEHEFDSTDYDQLLIMSEIKCTTTGKQIAARFNNDAASHYQEQYFRAQSGTVVAGAGSTTVTSFSNTSGTSDFVKNFCYIKNKAAEVKDYQSYGGQAAEIFNAVGYWNDTSAKISKITILGFSSGVIATGSKIWVYGLVNEA